MKSHSDYLVEAISNLKPGSEFSFTDADYSTVVFDVIVGNPPTLAAINAEIARIKEAELAA